LEGPGAGVLCLTEDDTLVAVGLNGDVDCPARTLPGQVSERLLEFAADNGSQELLLEPEMLAALDLPKDWSSGLVLPLPVRDGVLGVLLLAQPKPASRPVRVSLEALATQLALALEGARLTEKIHLRRSEARF